MVGTQVRRKERGRNKNKPDSEKAKEKGDRENDLCCALLKSTHIEQRQSYCSRLVVKVVDLPNISTS